MPCGTTWGSTGVSQEAEGVRGKVCMCEGEGGVGGGEFLWEGMGQAEQAGLESATLKNLSGLQGIRFALADWYLAVW